MRMATYNMTSTVQGNSRQLMQCTQEKAKDGKKQNNLPGVPRKM